MAMYRVYCLNSDGAVSASHWIEARSDADVIETTKKDHPDTRCEIWLGKQLVAKIDP